MSKLLTYFKSWPSGSEPLNEKQLLALQIVAQLDQTRAIDSRIMEEIMDDRKHPDRKRLKTLKRDRLFKYFMDTHDVIGGKIRMSLPYVMLICSLSTSKRDILLYHSYCVYFAKKEGFWFIDVDFWALKVFHGGLIKNKVWRQLWKDQLEEGFLEDKTAWKELHQSEFTIIEKEKHEA